jgi:archaellum biogenesis ATPase FlaH
MEQLSKEFLQEMFKSCLRSQKMLNTLIPVIEYHYLPEENYKRVWKSINNHYKAKGSIPTIGILYEANKFDEASTDLIAKIRDVERPKDEDLLHQVESFVKQARFVELHDTMREMWEKNEKDKAISILKEEAELISRFSLSGNYHHRVFGDYGKRVVQRKLDRISGKRESLYIPTLIDELDAVIGGIKKKQTMLVQGQSGFGKSTFLRMIAVNAAVMGYKVAFLSAEDSEEDVMEALDQTWMNVENSFFDSDIPEELREKYEAAIRNIMSSGGEIFVRSFEDFGSANMSHAFETVADLSKIDNIDVDLIVMDYLDEFEPIREYKRGDTAKQRINVAKEMKNLALQTNTALVTCTQGSTVDPALLNDPTFVQTRYNIADVKGLIRPFSYFGTINRTADEKRMGMARLHWDKFRKYGDGQTMTIYQALERGQFYNKKKTRQLILSGLGASESDAPKKRVANRNKSKK